MSNLTEAQKEILTIEYFFPDTSTATIGTFVNVGKREPEYVKGLVQRLMSVHETFRLKLKREGEVVTRYYVDEPATIIMGDGEVGEIKRALNEKSGRSFFAWDDYLYEMSIDVANDGDVYVGFFAHHLIADGIGIYVYAKGLYDLLTTGECDRPMLTLDECVSEEQAYESSSRSEKSRKFWIDKVGGYTGSALADMRKIDKENLSTNNYTAQFNRELTSKLEAYCQTNNVSLTGLISGAVLLYKSKMTNNNSVAINATLHGRSNRKKRSIFSTFARALPLIVDIQEEWTVLDYLDEIKTESAQLMRNYKISHYDLMASTKDVTGLDDLSVSVQLNGRMKEEFHPTFLEGGWLLQKESMRPLTIHVKEESFLYDLDTESQGELELSYEFIATVFEKSTIEVLHNKLEYLLTQMISSPETIIKDVTILTDEEYDYLVHDYQLEYTSYPKEETIVDMFEKQVVVHPTRTALIYNDVSLSYAKLNEKANQLAHYLIENYDLQPEDTVGLLLDRSEWMVIAILGVLKAGAAYVPVSPEFPQDRVSYIEKTAAFKLALVEDSYAERVENPELLQNLDLTDYPITTPKTKLLPTNLAYIIFTSGTTGQPKGVMVEHHHVSNLVPALTKLYALGEEERVLFFSNYVFDASVEQIYMSFLNGYQLVMMPDRMWMDSEKFTNYLNDKQVTYMHMTPSMLLQMDLDLLTSIKYLSSGGEALNSALVEKVRGLDFRFMNVYGPTETTVITLGHLVENSNNYSVIGSATQNTTLYVLDSSRRLVPKGTIGELYIGGVQVSRGYINQPELTVERFIPNPFQTDKQKTEGWNDRIYQTGDLVRILDDNTIEYHGRSDFQVKIRGYRIELEEIEATLLQIPVITQAHVMALGEAGSQYLGAYYVSSESIPEVELDKILAQKLPDYMIPSGYHQMTEFPLTVNGKLDRRSLPEISFNSKAQYIAPTTEEESAMCAVFGEVLRSTTEIGIDDGFFVLGGDSIKAIQIVSKLREKGYQTDVRNVMELRTPREIAKTLTKVEELLIDQSEVVGEVGLTPIQKDFIVNDGPDIHHFNQSMMLESQIELDEKLLMTALNALVEHHDMLRATYQADKTQEIGAFETNTGFQLMIYNYHHLQKDEWKKELETTVNDIQRSIDITTGPLFKIGLFKTPEKDLLFLCLHHLVVDGVSWRILVEDLITGYRLTESDKEIILPQKTSSFRDWSEALQRYYDSGRLNKELSYWKNIERNIEFGNMPVDVQESEEVIKKGTPLELLLTKEQTSQYLYEAPQAYHAKLNDLLLTAVVRAISSVTGQTQVSINMEGHGREDIKEAVVIDRTVGWFTSVYPFVVSKINQGMEKDICLVKETLRRIPNGGIGYGVLKSLGEEILKGLQPAVTFNYLGEFVVGASEEQFVPSALSTGDNVSEKNTFGTAISIDSMIVEEQLKIQISYNETMYTSKLMERLQQAIKQQLTDVLNHCLNIKQAQHTASDFGELTWSHSKFKQVEAKFSEQKYEIEQILPLTGMQEGMLYHKLLSPESTEYVIQSVFSTSAFVSEVWLKQSLELLTTRHQVLRSSIVHNHVKEPRQVVLKTRDSEFSVIDLTKEVVTEESLQKLYEQDVMRGFDLEDDSLIRMILIKLPKDQYRLVMSFHHVIMDGWCTSILMNELLYFYDQLSKKEASEKLLQNFPQEKEYSDYVHYLQSKETAPAKKYWQELLSDYEGTGIIPPIGAADEDKKVVGRVEKIQLTEEETHKLEEIAGSTGVTINTLVEAAWGILLQRMNHTEDVVFGKVVSGRDINLSGIETMVGLFINTIPIRVRSTEDQTFKELVTQLQKQALQSSDYDHYDLAEIQKLSRSGSHLIQSILIFENYLQQEQPEHKLELTLERNREEVSYDLSVAAYKSKQLTLEMGYNPAKYSAVEVADALKRMKIILCDASCNPTKKVTELDIMSKEEQTELLELGNTYVPYPKDKTLIDLLEEQVLKTPNNPALVYKDVSLTYAELNAKVNQLAHYLIDTYDIKPEDKIGLLLDRSEWMVISVLGVLKAGAAYVPISPEHPKDRMAYIAETAEFKTALVEAHYADQLEHTNVVREINLDSYPTTNPTTGLKPNNLAYILFTSGTTGRPKGVMLEHHHVNNLIPAMKQIHNLKDEGEIILFFTNYVFDPSVEQMFLPLLNGYTMVVSPDNLWMSPENFTAYLNEHKVTYIHMTPSMLLQLHLDNIPTLKNVVSGGESVTSNLLDKVRDLDFHFVNLYGPTEATVNSTSQLIDVDEERNIIGGALPNMTLYILDDNRRVVPKGTIGELYVGGVQVSRGYCKQPELTAEKFIPNPFQTKEQKALGWNERIYQTGDLVRWVEDEKLEYHGRSDFQVKIRGFRIELGEIEETLLQIPEIKQAHVMAISGASSGEVSNQYLGAYYVADEEIPSEVLDTQLAEKLPDYMIPSVYQYMEKFPLTVNGKLDRRALPEIKLDSEAEYVSPRSELETIVAESFEEVLEVEQVGIYDDFFKLGGHSLRALRLINLLEERTGKSVQVKHVFEAPKVVQMATLLAGLKESNYERIPQAEEKAFYEMSGAQKRMYLLWKFSPTQTTYNMPAVLKFETRLDEQALESAINQLSARHEILRTTFTEKDGVLVQAASVSSKSSIKVVEMSETEVENWCSEAIQPFNLEIGPTYRAEIARTPERDYLFVDMHHIISDGMSSTLFVSELNALVEGIELAPLERQYKDYSEWMNNQDLSESENYWLRHLEDYPVLELPTDYARPADQQFEGATEKLILDVETTRKVKQFISETKTTEYMFFMGLISILLGKLANQEELIIASPVSGRVHKDTESMLGMFVNTLAMRLSPTSDKTFKSYLEELKAQTLEAQEHQIYPFEDIVEKIVTTRDRSRNPLFDVLVVYQNNEELAPVLGSSSFLETTAPAKIDLAFTLSDDGNETLIDVTYATSLFKEGTIKTYLARLTQLLDQVLNSINPQIATMDILLQEEKQELITEMGSEYTPYPHDKTIVAVIEEKVAQYPTATAVIYKDVVLTYTELNEKANQLAHYLIENYAIKPEDKIGLLLDRSEWMIIAILGVLKSGAAYVPISPEFPQDRMDYIAEEADIKLALTEAYYTQHFTTAVNIRAVDLSKYSCQNPITTLQPNNLAYIIFTSGTTGRPKGVMIEHHQVNNLIPAVKIVCMLGQNGEETVLFSSNYVFDASIDQIFSAFIGGNRLLISPDGLWMNPVELNEYLSKHGTTYIQMTPSLLMQLDFTAIKTLNHVLTGGESVTAQLMKKVEDRNFNFINAYGPTEVTVVTSTYLFDGKEERNIIGSALQNTTIYVLDANKRLVPKGTVGELYVGGVQVSRGYIKQPELTDERFIPNPFQTEKQKAEGWNDRLYQTGDLVRMLDDGNLEYHGRSDFQVKIRGYRIELGEIEETLLQIEGIKQTYVMAITDTASGEAGNQYLGAYYVADEEIPQELLDTQLGEKLPDYMIPSGYQHMTEFPITVNGKLDRRALPVIGMATAEYIAPRTELETTIAASYEEILELEQVGINDDFFKLGGHSLRALRLVNLLQQNTNKAIEVKHIFEAPKVVQLANLLESLEEANYERIPLAEEKATYEMSGAQKRMYLLWNFNPTATNYNMPALLKLEAQIDEIQLNLAINEMNQRHEILRTTFTEQDGDLVQVISPSLKTAVNITELSEAEVKAWYENSVQPFDLETGPMYRVKIARTSKRDYLFVDMHHIISDGMSSTIFVRELNALMNNVELLPLERQYKDYSEWMISQDLSASESYWLDSLADYPVLELQTDYPRPADQQFEGASEKITLDETTTKKIKALIRETGTTEYMFFMGLISILLGKLANQDDLIIGSPVSGRVHRDTENMLGMFVNTLAMRLQPTANQTFTQYLETLKTQTLVSQDHQIYPFEDLVEKLVTTRDASRNPLFDVLVVYQNNEELEPVLGATSILEAAAPAKFDLMFTLFDDGQATYLDLTYATSLFSEATIKTYLARLMQLLAQILTDVNQEIKELELILDSEKDLVLNRFNNTAVDFPQNRTIASQFEEQARLNPTKIAVGSKDQHLTYQELDARANEVALKLVASGIDKGDFVAIIAKRDVSTIIGFLGILKAGGAYMPIDADYPESRIKYMLEDSGAKLIIGNKNDLSLSTDIIGNCHFICPANLTGIPQTIPIPGKGEDLAYLLYTSGTTGNPKGVMVEQQSITRLVKNTNYADFTEVRILQTGSLSFDASTFEIWGALLNGGYVFISDMNVLVDDVKLKTMIADLDINTMWLTASLYNHLVTVDVAVFDDLRQLLIGGEALSKLHVDKLLNHNPNINLINGYGPTETTTFAVTLTMNGPLPFDKIPIGKPIANTTNYIMTDGKLSGIGIPGELCIGGPGVARGYLNSPELTEEKFINNPFGEGRLYRTGDLVRWLSDGHIEYLGRFDDQVKIRGHRIELGEIETAIRNISEIDNAVVVVRDGQIHAYLQNPTQMSHAEITSTLKANLPDYMIPNHYMDLETFPVTSNGKVNKRALPIIEVTHTEVYIAPRTELEITISESYKKILEVDKVGINDDFFKLGGHSLRALRVVNLLEEATGKAVGIKHIFEAPTVKELAKLLETIGAGTYERIPQASEKASYEMSSTQKRMYLLWKLSPREIAYNIPTLITLADQVDATDLTNALTSLARRHEILRTTFHEADGKLIQQIHDFMDIDIQTEAIKEAEIHTWYEKAIKPFDLEKGPMYRIQIGRTETTDYLFVDMHHIISDGMSSNIFASEINQLMTMPDMVLPPLERQYKDYSEWMQTQDMKASEDYWKSQLDDYPILSLPTDNLRPEEKQFDGATEILVINASTTRKIKALIQKTGATEYMFFMGLISILLGKLANQTDLVIGSPVSGRIHKDTETMLGMFVNTLAMRLKPTGDQTFNHYLETLKADFLEAQLHQAYPFEDLVDQLVTRRDRSRTPLFDVMVVYQNNESISPILGADNHQEVKVPAKFDLNFALSDDGKETTLLLTYATSLFKKVTIEATLIRLVNLLDQILADETKLIKDLDILLAEESSLLIENVGTYTPFNTDKTILDVFEAQVLANPNKLALVYKDTTYTYAELNKTTNQLAHYLKETYQIHPEDTVGLLLDRSHFMIISILGVMKAGAGYVPISPEFPEERISYIEETARLKTTLVEAEYANHVTNPTLIRELDLSSYPETSPIVTLTPESLAYIIFTSGTTGRPKGVMLEHRNVLNMVPALVKAYELVEDEVILFFSNYVFDVSVEQIFLGLLNGYPLIVTPDRLWMNQAEFTAYLNDNQVTYVHTTPSLLSQIEVSGVPSIKRTIVAGESVNPALVERMHDEGMKFINAYGPTEATVISTTHTFAGPEVRNIIGKAITNTTVYVLDENKQPVPMGTSGELYLGGAQVARGYIKQPELTAEVFIQNPHQTTAQKAQNWNDRIYKTGDIVRFLEDGSVEYQGRTDFQVKIRGYRIELGEIEATLLSLPDVRQAHVMALGEDGNQYLGAYYVSDNEISLEILNEELAKHLPDYMIPSGYQHMIEFPVTVNGKLDRRALPEIGFSSVNEYIVPATPMEILVAQAFGEILEMDQIGAQDDFFQLGGHSLRALRLVNLLKERTGRMVEVVHIFESPKVAQLAKKVETLSDIAYDRIPLAEDKPYYDMSPSQKRLYKFWKYRENKNGIGNNMPLLLKFKERLDEMVVQKAFETLVSRHEIYRTTFKEQGEAFIQVIHDTMPVNIPTRQMEEAAVETWFNQTVKPFDLEQGPLYRVEIVRTQSHDHLFIDTHHIISDGRSHTNMTFEMAQLLQGVTLPSLDRQFKDYSEWMNAQDLSESESYWLENMKDYPVLNLPLDHDRPAVQDFEVGVVEMILDEETTANIKAFVKETGTTEYMFFLAAIGILLGKTAHQEELVIGSPMSGRVHKDLDNMLGMIVNSLPMRVEPSREKSFLTYLQEVKDLTLTTYDHQTYPLDLLKEKLVATPDLSRHDLYDVLYVYQNNEHIDLEALGLVDHHEYLIPEKLDLNYTLTDNGKKITILLSYATALFTPLTIKGYQESLKILINHILDDKLSTIHGLEV